ncbi:MAG: Xylose isomerase domain protein barrel [Bryobacterales bacterium]|nr:Xylose isomerase domain protein barrel [Bryobacterales bacterium]
MTRRIFSACSLAATGLAASTLQAETKRSVRLGGPVFLKSDDPAALAHEHRRLGYGAAYCPTVKLTETERLREIENAFAAENVVIAEVGAWVNMLDPNSEKRRKNLDYVTERLAIAEAVGARTCVDIAGSFNPDYWYGAHPNNLSKEFLDATVENCRHVIDAVKPRRTLFTIEMMPWSIPNGADSYLQLINAVDRKAFGVHMDVCNAVNSPERFYRNAALIDELFRKLGRWIASCHAKDLAWVPEYNVHFLEVVPGRGVIDYQGYLRNVAALPTDAPLMLEHLKTAAEYDEGRAYIQKNAADIGVTLA